MLPVTQNEFFSFEDNPRGRILQRDQKFVGSVEDMMALMQYNDPSDPMQGKAGHAIAARLDVPDAEPGHNVNPRGQSLRWQMPRWSKN